MPARTRPGSRGCTPLTQAISGGALRDVIDRPKPRACAHDWQQVLRPIYVSQ